jgi:hypothetical protein
VTDPWMEIERCISEQRMCAEYSGPDKEGALAGLLDWLMEEVLIRLSVKGNVQSESSSKSSLQHGLPGRDEGDT